ncbi:response regulator transcription factor [Bacillus sp. FJAT-47783]|uniref:response regulator transcription factor n=1 Tax=Bacillus sp. FJAT-47783 TaxID=2922712 RepID=UPI001FADDE35|nr:response regulator transcription factor [Bacillus sp. FJAT-47783]
MSNFIFIAEDDEDINHLVALHLRKEGYQVFQAFDGLEVLKQFQKKTPDLLILDVMMPKMDGFQVLQEVRNTHKVPVIMLTARGQDEDKVLGLGLGADDYVVKPFSIIELVSRVQAQIRRYTQYGRKEEPTLIVNGALEFDPFNVTVKKNGIFLDLKPKELKLLSILMKNIGRLYTKTQLYELVWDEPYFGDSNTIMVHISRLREKIEDDPKHPTYIKTVKGLGYRMDRHGS